MEGTGTEMLARAGAGHQGVDALWMSRLAIDVGSELLVARSAALRRLISFLGSLGAGAMLLKGTDGNQLDIADVHVTTMRHAQKKGLIRRNLDPVVLGTLVASAYTGTLLRWSYGGIDDTHLGPMSRLGLVSIAASASTPSSRTGLEREMAALNREAAAHSR